MLSMLSNHPTDPGSANHALRAMISYDRYWHAFFFAAA